MHDDSDPVARTPFCMPAALREAGALKGRIAGPSTCDDEPIHTPGSIQPHGMMLVVEIQDLRVTHVAGDVERRLGVRDWEDAPVHALIGEALGARVAALLEPGGAGGYVGQLRMQGGEVFDVSAQRSGPQLIIELESAAEGLPTASVLEALAEGAAAFERAPSILALCHQAATAFRALTRFDRVMVYRFRPDGSGKVVAEDLRPGLQSFLNLHFPESDIPQQARALYLRNTLRVIPDQAYRPVKLRPDWPEGPALDMSDCALRSVAPVHLAYLGNMGVKASASVSITRNGVLWGLIACHHATPRVLSYDIRAACRSLAGSMGRQIKAKEDAHSYRERLRLRGSEDDIIGQLQRSTLFDHALSARLFDVGMMMEADGVAILRGAAVLTSGSCPTDAEIVGLGAWLLTRRRERVFTSECLSRDYPAALGFTRFGSGLMAMIVSPEEPWILMCFRMEQPQTVSWAGHPDKAAARRDGAVGGPQMALTPRASFAAWMETVRGQSEGWTVQEEGAALRLCDALLEVQRSRHGRDLSDRLLLLVREKAQLLEQNASLLAEVNRGVQQTLRLVSTMLAMPGGAAGRVALEAELDEARLRLSRLEVAQRGRM